MAVGKEYADVTRGRRRFQAGWGPFGSYMRNYYRTDCNIFISLSLSSPSIIIYLSVCNLLLSHHSVPVILFFFSSSPLKIFFFENAGVDEINHYNTPYWKVKEI